MNVLARWTPVLLVAGLGVAGSAAFAGGAAAASSGAPYTDPNAVGSIGLCNQSGQQITSGSVTTTPFAWRAVSTQPARAPYNNAGRTATLVAYQPQEGLPPGDWSGAQLTSSSRYTNPANPMAAATEDDQSLQDIIEQYQPKWDGFLQLRIYLGTVTTQAYTQQYPALNIQVTGDTWQSVEGAQVNCASGTSVSIESILLPSTTTTSPTTTSTAATASAGDTSPARGVTPGADASPSPGNGASGIKASASGSPSVAAASRSSDVPVVLGAALAVLVVLAVSTLLLVILRRRRLAPHSGGPGSVGSPPTSSPSQITSSTKGDAK